MPSEYITAALVAAALIGFAIGYVVSRPFFSPDRRARAHTAEEVGALAARFVRDAEADLRKAEARIAHLTGELVAAKDAAARNGRHGIALAFAVRSLHEAGRCLAIAARTSGGTAGPDAALQAACEAMERTLAAHPQGTPHVDPDKERAAREAARRLGIIEANPRRAIEAEEGGA